MNVAAVGSKLDLLRKLCVTCVTREVLDAEVNAADVVLQDVTPAKRDVTAVAFEPEELVT